MLKNRENTLPSDRVLASRYCKGKVCDYPAEDVFRAINSFDLPYNSITIPIQLGFEQMFTLNIEAFCYLSQHRTETELSSFLLDPNGYMELAGIHCPVSLDEMTSKIMCAMLDKDMYEALSSSRSEVADIINTDKGKPWRQRHPERFPAKMIKLPVLCNIDGYKPMFECENINNYGFDNRELHRSLSLIADFFSMDEYN